ncbi:MAG: phytoene desaturase family protein, partial [Candidatus Bathyarchaeia archaeon]
MGSDEKTMTNAYDDVIIGAGHNSLVCAAYLSKGGYRVLVLEKEKQLGGSTKTLELTLPGFRHEALSGAFLSDTSIFSELKLESYGLKFLYPNKIYGSVFPDQRCLVCHSDINKTMKEFSKFSKKDGEAWQELYKYYLKMQDALGPIYSSSNPFSMRTLLTFYYKLRKKGFMEILKLMTMDSRSFVDEWFESEEAKSFVVSMTFHPDIAPETPGGAFFALFSNLSVQQYGMPLAVGGVQSLVNALVKLIKAHGGTFATNSEVTRILIEKGKAVGVELKDGKKIFAKKVIASVEPKQLFLRLVGENHLESDFVRKVKKYKYGLSALLVHIALDGPMMWKAKEIRGVPLIHVGPYVNDISKAANEALRGHLPSSPYMLVGNHTAIDPSLAPEGKHTLWIDVRTTPSKIKGDAANEISRSEWSEVKEEFADRCLAKLQEYVPLKNIILKRIVLSPQDIQNLNQNLVGGDTIAGTLSLYQFLLRPF